MAMRKAALGTRWASVTDVGESLRQARNNRQAQRRLLDELEGKVEQRRGEIRRSLSDLPDSQQGSLVARAASGFHGEMRKLSADPRTDYVRKAAGYADYAAAVRTHYRSPGQMLARHDLGSERRSRLIQQIAASGPAELASLAELAAATKDFDLAAALCSRVYELPPERRSFSPHELADVLFGADFRTVTRSLMEIDRLALEVRHDDTAFESGRPSTQLEVEIALMRRAEAEVGGDIEEPEQGTEN